MHRYPPSLTLMVHEYCNPCRRASYIIPRTISTPWGVCSPCCRMCNATSYTPGWREAIVVKCLSQGHKHHGHGQESNPHFDDSAMRTQVPNVESMYLWKRTYVLFVLCKILFFTALMLCSQYRGFLLHFCICDEWKITNPCTSFLRLWSEIAKSNNARIWLDSLWPTYRQP